MKKDPYTTNLGGVQLRVGASAILGETALDRLKARFRAVDNERGAMVIERRQPSGVLFALLSILLVICTAVIDPIVNRTAYIVGNERGDINPVAHPLGAPTINGNEITVDTMLKQPTRITRMLMDLTLQKFFVDRVYANGGGISGGAVIYDQATENELYLEREIEKVQSGQEFPLVDSARRAPKVAEVEKYGGKFFTTDEARDRNDAAAFTNQVRKLSNTIVRKINGIGVAKLAEALDGNGGLSDMDGNDWAAAIPNGQNPTAPALTPAADLANVHLNAEQRELGVEFNLLIVSPIRKYQWNLFYGKNAKQALTDLGFDEMYSTNRLGPEYSLAVAENQVGEFRVEQPLATETSRESGPQMRQRTWTQSSVRPIFFVTNPFAAMRINHAA